MERIKHLHVRKAVEEDDALDRLVAVRNFFDGFLAPLLGERLVAPIVQQPVMQPVLVDRGQFVPERLVEEIDDARPALHFFAPAMILSSHEPSSWWQADYNDSNERAKTTRLPREQVPDFVK